MVKNNYFIGTRDLIALCNIIDDLEEFQKRLSNVIKNNEDFAFKLWKISKGKFSLGLEEKKFYKENKTVIDTINKYSSIAAFINFNYDVQGNPNDSLKFFYKYISNHKDELDKILAVLEKLKELGISSFEFNSDLDFTQEKHSVYTFFSDNFDITYLENLTAIPDYNPGMISYKSNGSSYKMTVSVSLGNIQKYGEKFILNNLIFDPNRLPKALSKEEIFDKIIKLKDEKHQEYSVIKDSVNLGVGITDLYEMFNQVSSKIDNLENVEKKAELVELLLKIKEAILQMQSISSEYNKQISDDNDCISEEFLNEQKKAYIRKREDSKIHCCW